MEVRQSALILLVYIR